MSSPATVPDASRRQFLATWLGRARPAAATSAVPDIKGQPPRVTSAGSSLPPLARSRPTPWARATPVPGDASSLATPVARVAIVQGRHCLAYQRSFCSTCVERCPVPQAITRRDGLPMVNATACTGCGLCQDACPAPTNAILLLPRRTSS